MMRGLTSPAYENKWVWWVAAVRYWDVEDEMMLLARTSKMAAKGRIAVPFGVCQHLLLDTKGHRQSQGKTYEDCE